MAMAPLNMERGEDYSSSWRGLDKDENDNNNTISAVSFGLVATAVLIAMFLLMAIYERFLRPPTSFTTSSATPTRTGLQVQLPQQYSSFHPKLHHFPPSQATVYAKGVSVLMPGEEVPTFLAHPAPTPSQPEHDLRHLHL